MIGQNVTPKYGYCSECRELFKWLYKWSDAQHCPNKYHDMAWGRKLHPCWNIWIVRDWNKPPPKKLLLMRCKYCENRFVCLTTGWVDEKS